MVVRIERCHRQSGCCYKLGRVSLINILRRTYFYPTVSRHASFQCSRTLGAVWLLERNRFTRTRVKTVKKTKRDKTTTTTNTRLDAQNGLLRHVKNILTERCHWRTIVGLPPFGLQLPVSLLFLYYSCRLCAFFLVRLFLVTLKRTWVGLFVFLYTTATGVTF